MIADVQMIRRLSAVAAAAAAGIAVLAIFGWTQGSLTLTSVVPGLAQMKPITSACVIVLAVSLAIQWAKPFSRVATIFSRAFALAAAGFAVLTLCEYQFGWKLGLDRFLVLDQSSSGIGGRMGWSTALALAFIGVGAVFQPSDREITIVRAHLMTLGAAVFALFTLVAYVYSATYLPPSQWTAPMPINTAAAIFLLCAALFWSKPDRGFMASVHAADGSGMILRRLIPGAVLVPVVLGWFGLVGQRDGYFDLTLAMALFSLATISIFVALIVVNARSVKTVDAERSRAQVDLQQAYFSVERRVAERTQELNDALNRLADSERRYDLATEGSNSGILDLDIAADQLHCSRRWNEMLGRAGEEPLSAAQFIELVHPGDREPAQKALIAHFKGFTPTFSAEVRMRHADGSYRWMLSRGRAMRDDAGRAVRMIGSQTDISEIKALQEALRDASIRDGLTGLYNRTHFTERLTAATYLAHRHGLPLSYAMFDIDRFKRVNDTYGHQIGDGVIKAVGAAIMAEIRGEDVAARYGGDEFCIMFEGAPAANAVACLERIKRRVENTPFFASENRRFSVTLSFGISDLNGKSVPEVIESADRALYEAKTKGRSLIVVDVGAAALSR